MKFVSLYNMPPDAEYLYATNIAICVLNAFSAYTAIMLNSVTIHALRKTSSLPRNLKTLLLSLAVSDLGVGLLVQPMYIVHRVLDLTESSAKSNPIYNTADKASFIIGVLVQYTSEFGVMALSADRFLAIRLHLRYKELVTHSRVVAVVFLIWLLSAVPSTLVMLNPDNPYPIFAAFDGIFVVTTSLLCCKIYAAVRQHKNRIQALHVQRIPQNGEMMANVERQTPTVRGAFYIYFVVLVCYLPNFCINIAIMNFRESIPVLLVLYRFSVTLLFLNSSLNPLIYCWKMRHSTRCYGHTAKYFAKPQLRKVVVNFLTA